MQTPHPRSTRIRLSTHAVVGVALALMTATMSAQGDFFVIPIPVGKSIAPADVVELSGPRPQTASPIAPGIRTTLRRVSPDRTDLGDFIVPAGKLLIVTSIQVHPQTLGSGSVELTLFQRRTSPFLDATRERWVLAQSGPTQIQFSPGLAIDAGFALSVRNLSTSAASIRVKAYGYLTNAQ